MQCSQCGKLSDKKDLVQVDTYQYLCKSCKKMKDKPIVLKAFGRECKQTTGMCACCGLSAGSDRKDGWALFKAGWSDSDGVFYARLCAYPDEQIGCLFEVKPASKKDVEQALQDIYGDDLDALGCDLEDFGFSLSDLSDTKDES